MFTGMFVTVAATGKSQASGATSAGGTIPLMLSGEIPRYVRVAATAAACIRLGKSAQTAVVTDMQVQPGDSVIMHVAEGWDNFAVIQVAAAGVVQISPLENM
ncbi:MAG TPA: hypothetical protein VIE65_20670 [Methylobacter sp.]|jgi:hypothetical protein